MIVFKKITKDSILFKTHFIYRISIILICSGIISCSTETQKYNLIAPYIQAVGQYRPNLQKDFQKDAFSFTAELMPTTAYVLYDMNGKIDNKEDSLKLKSRMQEVSNLLIFNISLSENGRSIIGDSRNPDLNYYKKIEYFLHYAQYDFKLIHQTDTFICRDYHFERYYDYAPKNKIILSFEKPRAIKSDLKLTFNYPFNDQKELKSEFIYKDEEILNIPTLIF